MNRDKELLSNCIEYLAELWDHDSNEDWDIHWKDVIGLTNEEMAKFGLIRNGDCDAQD